MIGLCTLTLINFNTSVSLDWRIKFAWLKTVEVIMNMHMTCMTCLHDKTRIILYYVCIWIHWYVIILDILKITVAAKESVYQFLKAVCDCRVLMDTECSKIRFHRTKHLTVELCPCVTKYCNTFPWLRWFVLDCCADFRLYKTSGLFWILR